MRLPKNKSTRYSLFILLGLIIVVIVDFTRALMSSGFMSVFGLAALVACAPAMFMLAHFLGNHDLKPAVRQRNRDRFINKPNQEQ